MTFHPTFTSRTLIIKGIELYHESFFIFANIVILTQSYTAMKKEIERKFLIKGDFMPYVTSSTRIEQGYVAKSNELTIRIRTRDEKGYLTIKGRTNEKGMSRSE